MSNEPQDSVLGDSVSDLNDPEAAAEREALERYAAKRRAAEREAAADRKIVEQKAAERKAADSKVVKRKLAEHEAVAREAAEREAAEREAAEREDAKRYAVERKVEREAERKVEVDADRAYSADPAAEPAYAADESDTKYRETIDTATSRVRAKGETRVPRGIRIAIAAVFGIFFAYRIWEVIGSVVDVIYNGGSFTILGWVIMVIAALVPVIALAVAFWIGRRVGLFGGILVYLAAYAAASAVFFSLIELLGRAGGIIDAGIG